MLDKSMALKSIFQKRLDIIDKYHRDENVGKIDRAFMC